METGEKQQRVNNGSSPDLFNPTWPAAPEKRLTWRQRHFARMVFEGMHQVAAFRKVTPKASNWTERTVIESASRLRHHPGVQAALRRYAELLAQEAIWTRAQSVDALRAVVWANRGDPSSVGAVRELNLMHGYTDPVKFEVEVIGGITRRIVDAAEVEDVEVIDGPAVGT